MPPQSPNGRPPADRHYSNHSSPRRHADYYKPDYSQSNKRRLDQPHHDSRSSSNGPQYAEQSKKPKLVEQHHENPMLKPPANPPSSSLGRDGKTPPPRNRPLVPPSPINVAKPNKSPNFEVATPAEPTPSFSNTPPAVFKTLPPVPLSAGLPDRPESVTPKSVLEPLPAESVLSKAPQQSNGFRSTDKISEALELFGIMEKDLVTNGNYTLNATITADKGKSRAIEGLDSPFAFSLCQSPHRSDSREVQSPFSSTQDPRSRRGSLITPAEPPVPQSSPASAPKSLPRPPLRPELTKASSDSAIPQELQNLFSLHGGSPTKPIISSAKSTRNGSQNQSKSALKPPSPKLTEAEQRALEDLSTNNISGRRLSANRTTLGLSNGSQLPATKSQELGPFSTTLLPGNPTHGDALMTSPYSAELPLSRSPVERLPGTISEFLQTLVQTISPGLQLPAYLLTAAEDLFAPTSRITTLECTVRDQDNEIQQLGSQVRDLKTALEGYEDLERSRALRVLKLGERQNEVSKRLDDTILMITTMKENEAKEAEDRRSFRESLNLDRDI